MRSCSAVAAELLRILQASVWHTFLPLICRPVLLPPCSRQALQLRAVTLIPTMRMQASLKLCLRRMGRPVERDATYRARGASHGHKVGRWYSDCTSQREKGRLRLSSINLAVRPW